MVVVNQFFLKLPFFSRFRSEPPFIELDDVRSFYYNKNKRTFGRHKALLGMIIV